MNQNFNEMLFDELKCYRREGLWRSLGLLLVIILVIVGMILMEVNHVSPSNQNRFRVIGLTTVIALFSYLMPLMAANRVMRDHPDWVKKSGIRAKIPLPMAWHVKRLCVLGASLLVIGVGFASLYKPQVQQTNLKDQQDNIQVNNVIDVPEIEVPTSDSKD
ncbi:hypothetical protein KJR24_00580 [Streptococcus parasanguinis]|uniref:hypothetical protein n=1 Tax=Streptococcus parasanguinis TaxID=1318 RepID=UPI001BD9A107|nr:hypothetical protein [Streptococcus parasanguinis]MBT0906645.1 hypothetical protein [Streptococcus parasanguinis]